MLLQTVDWAVIAAYFVISLLIGIAVTRRSGSSVSEYFLSGRSMPWWLLGVSLVATTFSTDTPNLVTDIVRTHGVSGNWLWWAFLLTGMLTVFVYAKLWRRSGVLTDVEFYELRYSGKAAAFLRGFRALYLGVFFNVLIMASVTLAAIKIGGVMFNYSPLKTVALAAILTAFYSMLGGFLGVLITDFFQFAVAMFGSIMAAVIALRLPEVGGLSGLLANERVASHLSLLPSFTGDYKECLTVLIIPLTVQWWATWYPGSEPGGGGYVAQRMLAAKNEKHALGATLCFNVLHYALRPWPWIIVALCSMVVFPDIESLKKAFPHVSAGVVKNDLAYSAMLTFLPSGLLGIVVASLIAAYMSTIATHLNWGSSYVVNDFYRRFVKPESGEKELVLVGRISTALLMLLAAIVSLLLSNALQAFQIMLQVGAGTGLLFILRWFWWRINAAGEIAAMVVSFVVALYFQFWHKYTGLPELASHEQLIIGVAITTVGWVAVTLLTRPTDEQVLRKFYGLVHPGGPGWRAVLERAAAEGKPVEAAGEKWDLPVAIVCIVLGCFAVYGALFATGYFIYGKQTPALAMSALSVVGIVGVVKTWGRLRFK